MLDDLESLREELEAKEKEVEVAKVTLTTQKSLLPPWTLERIQREVIKEPNTNGLEPTVSFELVNSPASQFDFPLTTKAFLFRGFEHIEKAPLSD